jgi:hypothetical protein
MLRTLAAPLLALAALAAPLPAVAGTEMADLLRHMQVPQDYARLQRSIVAPAFARAFLPEAMAKAWDDAAPRLLRTEGFAERVAAGLAAALGDAEFQAVRAFEHSPPGLRIIAARAAGQETPAEVILSDGLGLFRQVVQTSPDRLRAIQSIVDSDEAAGFSGTLAPDFIEAVIAAFERAGGPPDEVAAARDRNAASYRAARSSDTRLYRLCRVTHDFRDLPDADLAAYAAHLASPARTRFLRVHTGITLELLREMAGALGTELARPVPAPRP